MLNRIDFFAAVVAVAVAVGYFLLITGEIPSQF